MTSIIASKNGKVLAASEFSSPSECTNPQGYYLEWKGKPVSVLDD